MNGGSARPRSSVCKGHESEDVDHESEDVDNEADTEEIRKIKVGSLKILDISVG